MRILLIFLVVSCLACKTDSEGRAPKAKIEPVAEMTFDREKWNIKEGDDYPYRVQMLHDIVYNDTVRSLNRQEIIGLLGEPSYYRDDKDYLYYTASQKRIGTFTLKAKTMVIKFSDDDSIDWIKIHE